ncbi:pyridoxal phosphate-dependent aminotransferase [Ancylomarina longa]|uniref:Aminotransferase n=1 Tax=Ancylomarina longa TaxID=2487017 RepID=A0A434AYT3_9BACT|nr:aminotransferase class I/II-fold pyridoxal phosphate-dependent enzyme [Ancylomarina longa]RUT79783.1 aminotransferase class I/II-fold pyridoxal phosphate-dependent enzyme [Ancylomarina longa]
MIHGHGDDAYLFTSAIKANFSTNIWYGAPLVGLKQHLFNSWDLIKSYPEASAESLRLELSIDLEVDVEQLIITNGATEAFYLIAQSFKGSKSCIVIPTFSEYEDACKLNEHEISFINWNELEEIKKFPDDLLWICNPNNPTGCILHKTALVNLLKINSDTTFILDEAYIDFTDDISSSIDLINDYKNLIIVKSLTKNFSIPGLRLGYLITNKTLVQKIEFYKAPWTVNSFAIEAGKYLLHHKNELLPSIKDYKSEKKKFTEKLSRISGLKIHNSKTPYFLVELEKSSAFELKKFLISEFGILIRDASNFRGLNSSFIRIATQSAKKNDLLIKALHKWSKLN